MENKTCVTCVNYSAGFCKKWKIQLPDLTAAETCQNYGVEATLNKGLQIRRNKLNKQARKRAKVKSDQVGLVCFVTFSEKIIEKVNGKYRHPTRTEHGNGLQIGNKIYLSNGRYKMVNRRTLKITKRYQGVPDWANPWLESVYQKNLSSDTVSDVKRPTRKSCKTCIHFKFSGTGYHCEVTGKSVGDYNHKEYCMAPQYRRKTGQNGSD